MKCILYKLLDFVFLFSFYFSPKFNKFTSCRLFTATPLLITYTSPKLQMNCRVLRVKCRALQLICRVLQIRYRGL